MNNPQKNLVTEWSSDIDVHNVATWSNITIKNNSDKFSSTFFKKISDTELNKGNERVTIGTNKKSRYSDTIYCVSDVMAGV